MGFARNLRELDACGKQEQRSFLRRNTEQGRERCEERNAGVGGELDSVTDSEDYLFARRLGILRLARPCDVIC